MTLAIALKEVWTVREVLLLHGLNVSGPRLRCPLCDLDASHRKSNSFSYTERGYHCFRCGEHGDIIKLEMVLSDCGFRQAIANLKAIRCGTVRAGKYVSPWKKLHDLEQKFQERIAALDRTMEVELHQVELQFRWEMIEAVEWLMLRDLIKIRAWREWIALEEERVAALFALKHQIKKELENDKSRRILQRSQETAGRAPANGPVSKDAHVETMPS